MKRLTVVGRLAAGALALLTLLSTTLSPQGLALAAPAPPAPVTVSPGSAAEPGTMLGTLTPTMQWNAVAGADYYSLAISKYPYGSANIIYNPQQVTGTSLVVPAGVLSTSGRYRWNMQAHGANKWSAVSNTLYFQAPPPPPATPTTVSPGSDLGPGPVLSSVTPTLQWNAASGADYYSLAISRYPYGEANIIYSAPQLYGTSLLVPTGALVNGERYRWNMRAYNLGGASGFSNTLYFQTPALLPPPAAPTAVAPGSPSGPGDTITTLTPTLTWNASQGAAYYSVAISIAPYGTSNIVYSASNLPGTSHQVPGGYLNAGQSYRWNMRAWNSVGPSDFSNTLYFQTSAPTPPVSARIDSYSPGDPNAPIRVAPGASTPLSVTFTNTGTSAWKFVAGATVWNSSGTIVGDYSQAILADLAPGAQVTVNFSHIVAQVGDYWVQFGVWKALPFTAANLLDKKPSPSQRLIVGDAAVPSTYSSLDYFNTTPGTAIRYHVTDNNTLDVYAWAVSQYFQTGRPDALDFVFTLTKEGTSGGYFRNSSLGGQIARSVQGKTLTYFYSGSPVGNQANFYFAFSLPRNFSSGDQWSTGSRTYQAQYLGSQQVGTISGEAIRVTIDDSQNASAYLRGSGYFILIKNRGIVKIVFNRADGSVVNYDFTAYGELARHSLSGRVFYGGNPVPGVAVQSANAEWGTRSITDAQGSFSIHAYGPDVVLRLGFDQNSDYVFDMSSWAPEEFTINNVIADVTGLVVNLQKAPLSLPSTGSISGRVTNTNGGPISGAVIHVKTYDTQTGQQTSVSSAATNAGGTYTAAGIPTGNYVINAFATAYALEYYGGTHNVAKAALVSVTGPGTTAGVDFVLDPGGYISGTVTQGDGSPLVGAGISVFEYDPDQAKWIPYYGAGALTGSDGRYVTGCVAAGQYLVYAGTMGTPDPKPFVPMYYNSTCNQTLATPVLVQASNTATGIDFTLSAKWTSGSLLGPEVTDFPSGTADIYVNNAYVGQVVGSTYKIVWYDAQNTQLGQSQIVIQSQAGYGSWHLHYPGGGAWPSGSYRACVLVNDTQIAELAWIVFTRDTVSPGVTINKAFWQTEPANGFVVLFDVVFSEAVSGFYGQDVALSGTAGPKNVRIDGSGTRYTVSVSGMASSGTIIATIPAGVVTDYAGNPNVASTSTDNTIEYVVVPTDEIHASLYISDSTPDATEEVLLDASGSWNGNFDSPITMYKWEFLDSEARVVKNGSTNTPKIFFYWENGGTYSVRLTVVTANGLEGSTTRSVRVGTRFFWEDWFKSKPDIDAARLDATISSLGITIGDGQDFQSRQMLAAVLFKPVMNEQILKGSVADAKNAASYNYAIKIGDLLGEMAMVDGVLSGEANVTLSKTIDQFFPYMAALTAIGNVAEGVAMDALESMGVIGLMISKGSDLKQFIGVGEGVAWVQKTVPSLEFWRQSEFNSALYYYLDLRRDSSHAEAWDIARYRLTVYAPDEQAALEVYFKQLGDVYEPYLESSGLNEDFKASARASLRQQLVNALDQYTFEPLYQQVKINSPAELRLLDSQGRMTGVVGGILFNDIPNAYYDSANETIILFSPYMDDYRLEVVGESYGTYGVDLHEVEGGTSSSFSAVGIPIDGRSVHEYTFNWSIEGEPKITLRVDSNGDGIFERTILSDSTLTADEFWPYTFADSSRGTELRVDDTAQTFQFLTSDKEFTIKKATTMRVIDLTQQSAVTYDSKTKKWKVDTSKLELDSDVKPFVGQYQSDDKPTKIILIQNKDQDVQLSAVVVDGKKDSCVAFARDLKTKKTYLLIDVPALTRP